MKSKQSDIDLIYVYIDDMIKKSEWSDLSRMFYNFLSQIDDMPLDIIFAYTISSLPAGSKIKYRRQFINKCKEKYPDENLWIEL